MTFNKANLRDLIAATDLVILLKLDSNSRFFASVTLKFDGCPRQIMRHVFYTTSNFVYHFRSISEFKLELQSGNAQSGSNSLIFFSHVTLQFDRWPWKTIGHLFYATSSFVHHFIAIGELKLELQSGNDQFGSKSTIFFSRVNLKFDRWPWKTIGHLFYATSSFVYHFVAIGEFKLEPESGNAQMLCYLEPCDLEIWRMTLKNNRAPLLCYFKLCASFHSHWWIQTGVTVRKRPIWVKFDAF